MFQIIFKIQPALRAPDVAKSPQARHVSVWHSINTLCHPIFVRASSFPVLLSPLKTRYNLLIRFYKRETKREQESENNSQLDQVGPGVVSRLNGVLRRGSLGLSAGRSGGPASAGHLGVRLLCLQLHMSTKIRPFKCLVLGFPNPLIERVSVFSFSRARAVYTGRFQDAGKDLFHL